MKSAKELLRVQQILWFAMVMASVFYVVVAYVILKPPPVKPDPMMPIALGVVAVVVTVVSFVLPRINFMNVAKTMKVETKDELASSAFPEGYRDAMPKKLVFANPEAALNTAMLCFQTPFILSVALSEAVALFGLVLAQLGFDKTKSLPFFVVGTILVLIRFPTTSRAQAMFEQAHGASFPSTDN